MAGIEALRGDTVAETIRNIVRHYWGSEADVPDDVISALLVLAALVGATVEVDADNARLLTNGELEEIME